MSLAGIVAWVMLSVLIAWIAIVLLATFHQLEVEAKRADQHRG